MLVWVKDERNLRVNFFFYLFSFCVYLMLVTELKYGNDPVDGEVAIDFGGEKGQAG